MEDVLYSPPELMGVSSRTRASDDWRLSFLIKRASELADATVDRAVMYFSAIGREAIDFPCCCFFCLVGVLA